MALFQVPKGVHDAGGLLSPRSAKRLKHDLESYISSLQGDFLGELHPAHYGVLQEDGWCTKPNADTKTELSDIVSELRGDKRDMYIAEPAGKIKLSEEEIEQLLAVCTPSGYGDLATATTKVDPEVRNSFETTQHPLIDQAMAAYHLKITEMASRLFVLDPDEIEVVPKKLIVYPTGGKFAKHVDTPPERPRHLGSAVTQFETKYSDNGRYDCGGTLYVDHDEINEEVCVFLPNAVHERTKVRKGARVSVTYELFAKGEVKVKSTDERLIEALKNMGDKPFGFVLANSYSLTQEIYGEVDTRVVRALETAKIKYVRVPVVIDYSEIGSDTKDAQVHAVAGFKPLPPKLSGEGEYFYPLAGSYDDLLSKEECEGAEFTGNESRESSLDMRYYATVLVCNTKE